MEGRRHGTILPQRTAGAPVGSRAMRIETSPSMPRSPSTRRRARSLLPSTSRRRSAATRRARRSPGTPTYASRIRRRTSSRRRSRRLEGGEAALAFGSGMAAGLAVAQALPAGSHVVLPEDVYYGYRVAARDFFPAWGLTASFAAMDRDGGLAAALGPRTRLVWLESPSNPLLRITDLAAAAAVAKEAGAIVLVDNTFATPILQRPLELGADVVLHATTKGIGRPQRRPGGRARLLAQGRAPREGPARPDDPRGGLVSVQLVARPARPADSRGQGALPVGVGPRRGGRARGASGGLEGQLPRPPLARRGTRRLAAR